MMTHDNTRDLKKALKNAFYCLVSSIMKKSYKMPTKKIITSNSRPGGKPISVWSNTLGIPVSWLINVYKNMGEETVVYLTETLSDVINNKIQKPVAINESQDCEDLNPYSCLLPPKPKRVSVTNILQDMGYGKCEYDELYRNEKNLTELIKAQNILNLDKYYKLFENHREICMPILESHYEEHKKEQTDILKSQQEKYIHDLKAYEEYIFSRDQIFVLLKRENLIPSDYTAEKIDVLGLSHVSKSEISYNLYSSRKEKTSKDLSHVCHLCEPDYDVEIMGKIDEIFGFKDPDPFKELGYEDPEEDEDCETFDDF